MTTFKNLFGIKDSQIKNTCVFLPFLHKHITQSLKSSSFIKGNAFSCAQNENFTMIYPGQGPVRVGDAVLALEKSPCRNLILIGACGLVHPTPSLNVGTIVSPSRVTNYESFSQLVKKFPQKQNHTLADPTFLKKTLQHPKNPDIKKVEGASFGSISLEQKYQPFLKNQCVDIVDLECCSFFTAAKHIQRKAIALLYISDILNKHNPYAAPERIRQITIEKSQETLYKFLLILTRSLK